MTELDDVLAHYGVKGMKWGVVKEYRADRREKGARKLESRAEIMNTRISELRKANEGLSGIRGKYKTSQNNSQIKNISKDRDRLLKDAEAKRNHKLTSTQKKVIVGAAVAAVVIGAAAYAQGKQSGAVNSYKLRGAAFLKGQYFPFKSNEHLAGTLTVDQLLNDVAKPVNPDYSKLGGKMNCRRSTFAYELRRRGFDVQATTSSSGVGQSESGFINAVTPGGKKLFRNMSVTESIQKSEAEYVKKVSESTTGFIDSSIRRSTAARDDTRANPLKKIVVENLKVGRGRAESSSMAVLKKLEEQPNGARGEVLFNFGTFGHSMAYEVVDGKAHIFDAQKGNLFHAAGKMVESKWDGFHTAEITRLDNANLDLTFLSRWATNVGDKK